MVSITFFEISLMLSCGRKRQKEQNKKVMARIHISDLSGVRHVHFVTDTRGDRRMTVDLFGLLFFLQ
jgi:hypothetical protein